MGNITKAVEGQTVMTDHFGNFTVKPSCGENFGRWYCITHNESFRNQFMKDIHLSKGDHQLAWICLHCGNLEVP